MNVSHAGRARQARFTLAAGLIVMATLLGGCAPAQKVPLENALSDKQIGATFKSRGTYGDIVIATVTSNMDQAIEVTVAPGALLINSNAKGESLVLYKYKGALTSATSNTYQENAQFVLHNKNAEQLALLEAYSVNALADPAQPGDVFTLDGLAGADLLAVLRAARDGDSIETKQIAVWAVSDNVTTQDLAAIQFKHTSADLAAAKSILQRANLDATKFKLFASNP